MEPTFYQHVVKQSFIKDGATVRVHAIDNGNWAVLHRGLFQSVRGKWHSLSRAKNFWNTHSYPYDEAVNRARGILGDSSVQPIDYQIQVSVSEKPTGADMLSVHLFHKENDRYVASTVFNDLLDAEGVSETPSSDFQSDTYHAKYFTSRENAFNRAVLFLKQANVDGLTIYNSGSAVITR